MVRTRSFRFRTLSGCLTWTGFGNADHKEIKNRLCSTGLFEHYEGRNFTEFEIDPDRFSSALEEVEDEGVGVVAGMQDPIGRGQGRLELRVPFRFDVQPQRPVERELVSVDGRHAGGQHDALGVLREELKRQSLRVSRLHAKLFYQPLLESVGKQGFSGGLSTEAAERQPEERGADAAERGEAFRERLG